MQVRYFAAFKKAAGLRAEEIEVAEGATLRLLLEEILKRHPEIRDIMDAALFSINLAHADPEEEVRDGDEVGLFPPVSGG